MSALRSSRHSAGMAGAQVDAVARKVAAIVAQHPEAAAYQAGDIL